MRSVSQKLVSGAFLRVITLLANLTISFFLTPFIIHSLGDRTYGVWVLVGTFIGYYGLLDFGLSNAVGRYISRAIGANDRTTINRVYNTGFCLFLAGGALALLVTLVAAFLTPSFVEDPQDIATFQIVLIILGVHSAIDLPMRVFHGLLQARLRFDLLAFVGLFTMAVRTLLIVLAVQHGYKLIGLALATLAASLSANIFYVLLAYRNNPGLRFGFKSVGRETVRLLFSYSVFVFILQIARQLRFQADAFVISIFVGLSAVAHYNIASMLVQHFDVLMGRIMGVLTPYFSQLEGADNQKTTERVLFFTTKMSIVVSSFVGFGFVAWGQDFIHRWMGVDYNDAYPCLVVLVAGLIFSFWQLPAISLLYGTSRHRFLALVTIVEGLVNLGLSVILVRYYGILGVALGTTVPLIVHKALIQPVYVCRVANIALSGYMHTIGHAVAGVMAAMIVPFLLAQHYAAPDYLTLFCLAAVSFVLYSLTSWLLVFNAVERYQIKKMFFYVLLAYRNNPGLRFGFKSVGRETVRLLFSYSVFVFILQIARQLRFQADAFVISIFVGLSAVAHYNIASMLVQHFDVLMGRIMGVLTPYFSQLEGADNQKTTERVLFFTTKMSIVVSSFVGFGFVAWGQDFIHRWMGVDYNDAYPCLVVLVAGLIFSFWQLPAISLLYGTSRHRFLALVTIVEGLVNLGLSVILVRYYGILGVALGTTVPLIVHKALIQPVYVCRVANIALSGYMHTIGHAVAGVMAAMIVPFLLAQHYAAPDYLTLFCLAAVSFVLYSLTSWLLVFNAVERYQIKKMLGFRVSAPKTVHI